MNILTNTSVTITKDQLIKLLSDQLESETGRKVKSVSFDIEEGWSDRFGGEPTEFKGLTLELGDTVRHKYVSARDDLIECIDLMNGR